VSVLPAERDIPKTHEALFGELRGGRVISSGDGSFCSAKYTIGATIEGTTMSDFQLARYRLALESEREEIRREIRSQCDDLVAQYDELEKVRINSDRNSAAERLVRMSSLLVLINDARPRLDEVDFGTCQACGASLSRQHLESVPWAPYCIVCQQLSERARSEVSHQQQPLPS
jgi:DnaK suppressor protein